MLPEGKPAGEELPPKKMDVLMVVLAPRVVVMLTEPEYGTVVVNGADIPSVVSVSTTTANAVV
jgi:hypothetical protein